MGVPEGPREVRVWLYHCCASGHCCGMDAIQAPELLQAMGVAKQGGCWMVECHDFTQRPPTPVTAAVPHGYHPQERTGQPLVT